MLVNRAIQQVPEAVVDEKRLAFQPCERVGSWFDGYFSFLRQARKCSRVALRDVS